MTIERVQAAARARGSYFSGEPNHNSWIRWSMFAPNGSGLLSADTLEGLYKLLKQFPRVR